LGSVTSYISQLPERGNADGLLGLAFSSLSKFRASPLLASLVRKGKLINPTFSFFELTSSGAEMYIGGENSSMLYNGDIAYTHVTSAVS
jgi:cathepsin D